MQHKIFVFLIALHLCFVPKMYAQNEINDTVLNEVLEKMYTNSFQLMGSRGLTDYPYYKVKFTTESLLQTLYNWDSAHHKVGMLIYLFDDNDHLGISFINNSGKTDTLTTSVTKMQLTELEKQLKSSIGAINNESPAKTRGVKLQNNKALVNTDSLVNIISNLLLPRNFPLAVLDHLVILPSANISAFPFAMLNIKDEMLIDKMSYSIIPSINEFIIREEILNKNISTMSGYDRYRYSIKWNLEQTVFIGNPVFRNSNKWNFKPLPGAEMEVTEISKNLTEKIVLKGKDATKANLLPYLSNNEIIYFATHAIADSTDPLNKSFLLLAGDNAKDAFLTTKEIQDLAKENPIKAFLVVLSACETGLGKSHAGGMIGMSRAFMIAGAQNVLMSLWEISDAKTPVLMKYFFEYLVNDGNPQMFLPYGALQKAIIKFKKDNKDPRYWAAFSMMGITL